MYFNAALLCGAAFWQLVVGSRRGRRTPPWCTSWSQPRSQNWSQSEPGPGLLLISQLSSQWTDWRHSGDKYWWEWWSDPVLLNLSLFDEKWRQDILGKKSNIWLMSPSVWWCLPASRVSLKWKVFGPIIFQTRRGTQVSTPAPNPARLHVIIGYRYF